MCGFAGLLAAGSGDGEALAAAARRMADALAHRGPDDAGVWVDAPFGLALSHRRLSILDLSAAGHQPMLSAGGRYAIAYNGEIYNHLELRAELERAGAAPAWRGHSDTETLLAAFEAWGLQATLGRAVGMFAFALWDREAHVLSLVRDRMGEKPLYYGWVGGWLAFGSELKALRALPRFDHEVDRDALALYMRHNYVPAPYSIHRDVRKVMPGCIVTFDGAASRPGDPGREQRYWSLRSVAERGLAQPFAGGEEDARAELERLLNQSIAGQRIADVPLGAFLSGGVDSSTVVALMQSQSTRPVRTFTIGFHEGQYDESAHAAAVARHLGTDHTALTVTARQTLDVIPKLPTLYDEPFADSSQVPTFLVCQLARAHVTVSLSGDGGDELFGGYNRYFWALDLWSRLQRVPATLRRAAAAALGAVPPAFWNGLFELASPLLPARWRVRQPGDKVRKLAGLLGIDHPQALYLMLVSHWNEPQRVALGSREPLTPLREPAGWLPRAQFAEQMMALDAITYLPDDILVKVDRAAMGVSLETRVPLLDHRVVEFAWSLPLYLKIRNGVGKWLLRQVLYEHVPRALIERPKMGFGVPIDHWLRGPLRDWAESQLDEGRLRREGYFDPAPIRGLWRAHLAGRQNAQYLLWDVLMFQAWREHWQAH